MSTSDLVDVYFHFSWPDTMKCVNALTFGLPKFALGSPTGNVSKNLPEKEVEKWNNNQLIQGFLSNKTENFRCTANVLTFISKEKLNNKCMNIPSEFERLNSSQFFKGNMSHNMANGADLRSWS